SCWAPITAGCVCTTHGGLLVCCATKAGFLSHCTSSATGFAWSLVHNAHPRNRVRDGRSGVQQHHEMTSLPMVGNLARVVSVGSVGVLSRSELLLDLSRDTSGACMIVFSFTITLLIALTVVGIRLAVNWIAGMFAPFTP